MPSFPISRPDDTDYHAMDGSVEMSEEERRRLSSYFEEQGDPKSAPRRSKLASVAGYIIVTEFCERLAYYGFSGGVHLGCQPRD